MCRAHMTPTRKPSRGLKLERTANRLARVFTSVALRAAERARIVHIPVLSALNSRHMRDSRDSHARTRGNERSDDVRDNSQVECALPCCGAHGEFSRDFAVMLVTLTRG